MLQSAERRRPLGITLLSVFFALGFLIALSTSIALLTPGGPLEPMWSLNPHVRQEFARLGVWALAILLPVAAACAAASVGLWLTRRYGYVVALLLIFVNLVGDLVNVLLGTEPRAAVGIPIAAAIAVYLLSRRVRQRFLDRAFHQAP
jgi:hypothetical protein